LQSASQIGISQRSTKRSRPGASRVAPQPFGRPSSGSSPTSASGQIAYDYSRAYAEDPEEERVGRLGETLMAQTIEELERNALT
jgi:hypothetical protein